MDLRLISILFACCVAYTYGKSFLDKPIAKPKFAGTFTVENIEGCQCTKYELYCEQNIRDRPYQQKAAELCASLSVLPGGPKGRLAVLRDQGIDSRVRSFALKKAMNRKGCISKHGMWIGLGDAGSEGKYTWSDGTAVCEGNFVNWAEGEPNNTENKDEAGQDCVQLWFRGKFAGQWDDEYCDHRPKGIVCEIPDPFCHSL